MNRMWIFVEANHYLTVSSLSLFTSTLAKFQIRNQDRLNIEAIVNYIKTEMYSECVVVETQYIESLVREDEEILYYTPVAFEPKQITFQLNKFIWFIRLHNDNKLMLKEIPLVYYRNKNHIFNENGLSNSITIVSWEDTIKDAMLNYNVLFVPHWGWTDFVLSNGMINYYSNMFSNVLVGCMSGHYKFVKQLFSNNKVIEFPWFLSHEGLRVIYELFENNVIFLVDGHQGTQNIAEAFNRLGLVAKNRIQELNLTLVNDNLYNYTYNEFNGNGTKITEIKRITDDKLSKFDERLLFYTSIHIPHEYIISHFKIDRNKQREEEFKTNFIQNNQDYIIVQHIPEMNDTYFHGKHVIRLNDISDSIVETLSLIEDAKEIHVYDSLYGLLVYLLYFSSSFFHGKKIFFHKYARSKIPKVFNLVPFTDDWVILE